MLTLGWVICVVLLYCFVQCSAKGLISVEKQNPMLYVLTIGYVLLTIISLFNMKNTSLIHEPSMVKIFIVILGIIYVCLYVIFRNNLWTRFMNKK